MVQPYTPYTTAATADLLFEPIPPFLVQMTVVHEPSLKLSQLGPHLAPLFCKTLGRCTLLLGVLAVGRTSRCKPRQAILCFGPVDLPPCREQRPLRLYAGLWQGVPLRV